MPEISVLPHIGSQHVSVACNEKDSNISTSKAFMTEKVISISESDDPLIIHPARQTLDRQPALLSRLTGWLPFGIQQKKTSDEGEIEMAVIMADGRELYQLANDRDRQNESYHGFSSPSALSLTGKVGLLVGAGLLAGAAGTLAYRRLWPVEQRGNGTDIYLSAFPAPPRHDTGQIAWQPTELYSSENSSWREHLPQPAARVAPREQPGIKTPQLDDVKKIAIGDLNCYKIIGLGRLAHKRKIPCKNSPSGVGQQISRSLPLRKYYYTKNQPGICKTKQFEGRCQKFHSVQKAKSQVFKNVVLHVGKIRCLCPPPLGEKIELVHPHFFKEVIHKGLGKTRIPDKRITPTISDDIIVTMRSETITHPLIEDAKATTSGQVDDVKIEKLFDFSCIDERENISWADIIKQVGKTLASPVKTLGDESLIIHYHNTLGQGCPKNQTIERIDQVTSKIDPLTTQILTLLPGSQFIAVAQLIVAPALEVLADDLSGKPIDLQNIASINQQLMFMVRQTIPTLSGPEMASLYASTAQQQEIKGTASGNPVQRFTLKDDKLAVMIGEKAYSYRKRKSGESYVTDGEDTKVVAFNKSKFRWDFINNDRASIYSSHNFNEKKKFGIPITDFIKNKDALLLADNENADIISLTEKNGKLSEYVLTGGFLVPVEQYDISDSTIYVATSPKIGERSILLPTEYGWVFEQESTAVDENLDILLASSDGGVIHNHQRKFTNIMPDGFSYDAEGKIHLKYKGKYHEVNNIFSSTYNFPEQTESLFNKENDNFHLRNSPDIIFGHRNDAVGYSPLEPASESATLLRIEEDAFAHLCSYGQKTDATPSRKIGPGVYVDDKGVMIFVVEDKKFIVSSFSEGRVVINNAGIAPEKKNIGLFLSKDIYLREREINKESILNYIDIEHCTLKRSPEKKTGCLPLVITDSLDNLLKANIKLGNVSKKTILSDKLIEYRMPDFPNLFVNPEKGRYYYLYDGNFFRAEIIPFDNEVNAAGRAMLRIFTKGDIFREKKDIANVIFDKKNGRVELKTQTDFLAEKLGMRKGAINSYLQNRVYNSLARLDIVRNVVSHVVISKQFYITPPREKYVFMISDEDIKGLISRHFYPDRIIRSENVIELTQIKKITDEFPLYLRGAKVNINNAINHLTGNVIPGVIKELTSFSVNCENYLRIVLNTDNIEFLRSFANALKKRLVRTKEALNMDNIYSASLIKKPLNKPEGKWQEVFYHKPILTPSERNFGTLAFALLDRSKRIYLNVDKLYFVDPTHPDESMRNNPVLTLSSTLLHEATHVGMMTTDIVYFPLEDGDMIPVLDAKDDMIEKIRQGKAVEWSDFKEINQQYFNKIALYRGCMQSIMEPKNLAYIAAHDPGYLAHLLLNTADGIAILTRDIYQNRLVKNK